MSMTMRRILYIFAPIGMIVLTIVAISILNAAAPEAERSEPEVEPLQVFAEPVQRIRLVPRIRTQGEAQARTEIDLISQVAGRVVAVAPGFVEGGSFLKDEALVTIDDRDFELAVVRARARVAEARQALTRESAEAEMARQDWAELGEGEASPLTLREPQLAQARAALEAAQADLAEADLNLARTRISVPFDGRVRSKSADLGQYVTPGNPLGRVFSTDIVEIRLPLTDRELGILRLPVGYNPPPGEGRPVDLSARIGGSEHHWQGRLVRTDSAIDTTSRVLFCVVEVQDPYGAAADDGVPLPVGLFVTADIPGAPLDDALVVPRAALRSGERIYVITNEGKLDIRAVDVALTDVDQAVIRSGVTAGEIVVTSPILAPVAGMPLVAIGAAGTASEPSQSGDPT